MHASKPALAVAASLVVVVAAGCPPPHEVADAGPPPGATLHVKKGGDGHGAITSAPDGVNCDNDCLHGQDVTFPSTVTKVTLTATAARDALFDNWHCSGTKAGAPVNSIEVQDATVDVIDDPKPEGLDVTCTANFKQLWNIQVFFSGDGQEHGHVTGTAPATDGTGTRIACPTKCTAGYFNGDQETLTATADPGFVFAGWKLDCASAGTSPATLTLDANKNCEAHICTSADPSCP